MDAVKKWVLVPVAYLVGFLVLLILLAVLGVWLGFLWGLLIVSAATLACGVFLIPKLHPNKERKNLMGGVLTLLVSIWAIVGVANLGAWIMTPSASTSVVQSQEVTPEAKAAAQEQLNRVMSLAKKARLITTYEFSDSAAVVYADTAWYIQTVQFKKDFLAKIGTLKKQITGYQHFEVRDAYSNEKVAEITSFGGSLEVYK
ncbi:hypothetical protein A2852_00095 [Candidatus Adlerbacteria bacterium RIFCSPHIGHO2_01_FULL_54_23]|uniref:Uncharacterized protein n=3 Tax=Candidatus Adleribacteriota TaxID=1752736 RepID=A0A1F4Y0I2_9BACT|nr:MAG: hypothetical protein UY83_C0001G0067 [Candidatus Adlerbacteria bacterium GW2011_GWA1_54_10]KKW36182.1 MAG: hypothetical protein UY84_C0001G0070 [Candidatus Adlerbacteria bacterium GW2011_GWA2_54_12]KKW37316.1 MAG: hypothetical protein UY86_C0010G0004 [Candidatus Adlerbacteria bacterium GW2011_GWB1_54_7]OGC78999.1 MAG: hypothetical protein A2852_00095 [Candidatus Adlerbacteria bacterium RIFCSPHIGHO2_01_FULL_54_23]OGC87439.1 MAG: hypothetical protein A3B33_02180 [Candidatus Adlerbacteria 